MKQHGPWQIVESNEKYRDPWVTLTRDEVIRPDGEPGSYVVVNLKPGVCVVAVDSDNNVYLTREFHYGVGRVTLEAVSGGIDVPEEPLTTAKRELREEVGISAQRWTDLGTTDPFTANVVSPTQMYLARDLTFVDADPEGTELIQCVRLPFEQVLEHVMDGTITHSPSCVAILKASRLGL